MKNQVLIVILIGVGVPTLICGGLGFITLANRPGHDAGMMFLGALVTVSLLAGIPVAIRYLNKR